MTSAPTLLLADCGASSGKWAYIDRATGRVVRFATGPVNAAVHTPEHIAECLDSARRQCPAPPAAVAIYAAGAVGEGLTRLRALAAKAFGTGDNALIVDTDLALAARALLGPQRGIACILGTGSNSCLWSGTAIAASMPPMGYILGDEGSGASMGRELLALVCKGLLDSDLHEAFASRYPDLDYPEIVRRTYREPGANRFLASFAPFLADNIRLHQAQSIVDGCFEAFISRFYRPLGVDSPLGIVGSIASAFAPQLGAVAARGGVELLAPVQSPLQRLVAFHSADAE